jgi:magnesium and cobalt transporter
MDTSHSAPPPDPSGPGQSRRTGLLGRLFGGSADPDEAEAGSPRAIASADGPPRGLGNLRRLRVYDVAVPRVEIVAVSADAPLPDVVEVFRDSGLTRLPVYDGTLDHPAGFVHLKDLALKHGFNGHHDDGFDLRGMVRPLLYVPPSMPIGVLLTKMQTDRTHMALVIDEYGGVDGLVTIEDLIEQVVGEISDEHDQDEAAPWTQEKPGVWLALARTPLDEFEAEIGMTLATEETEEEEIDTLGGLVFVLSGRVPARGEVVRHPAGPEFEVVEADPRRISRLRVRLIPAAAVE